MAVLLSVAINQRHRKVIIIMRTMYRRPGLGTEELGKVFSDLMEVEVAVEAEGTAVPVAYD